MIVAVSAAFFLLMLAAASAAGYWLWARQPAAELAPASGAHDWTFEDSSPDLELPHWLRVLSEIGSLIKVSDTEGASVRRQLATAGYRHESAVAIFHGLKASGVVLIPLTLAVIFYIVNPNLMQIAPATLLSAYVAFRLPDWVLQRQIGKRRIQINRGLPDLLDLLVIAVESGLSLEQALADTGRDLKLAHPVLGEEIIVFQLETAAGTSRTEALRNMGLRTGEPEMRKLTSLLIQADRFGTSISRMLRTQARYMRTRRRQRAEEMAHKVGVKLIFPIFFLIMPSMFLVTAGPAVLYLLTNFSKLMGN
jgi:tight adherence protein C